MITATNGNDSLKWAKHTCVECMRHLHSHLEIIIVAEGELEMKVGDKTYDICAGYGIFVSPFEPHEFHSRKFNRCTVLMFSGELIPNFCEATRNKITTRHIFAISPQSFDLAECLLVSVDGVAEYFEAQAVLAPLCLDILRGCEFAHGRRLLESSAERAFEYISTHFSENISQESVARAVGLHPVTLSKIFSKKMGVGFNDCVRYVRCINAATMIKSSYATFTEIAMACGFGSVRSFNRNFIIVYGVTPTEYKKGTITPT